jgi:hypothetical protein
LIVDGLWRDQKAPELPVHRLVHEGFDTRDLKATKALLEELAAQVRLDFPLGEHLDVKSHKL